VVGREFDLSLVEPASELSGERILDSLSEAVALGVVVEDDGTGGGYNFSHSLIREVLYERLPIPVRLQLHRRIGEAIERLYSTGTGTRRRASTPLRRGRRRRGRRQGAAVRPAGRRAGHR
jgi:predicted ATPase